MALWGEMAPCLLSLGGGLGGFPAGADPERGDGRHDWSCSEQEGSLGAAAGLRDGTHGDIGPDGCCCDSADDHERFLHEDSFSRVTIRRVSI